MSFKPLQKVTLILVYCGCLWSGPSCVALAENTTKEFKICSVPGGAELARFASRNIQTLLRNAVEDVEFVREYLAETMKYNPNPEASTTLEELANSLDWEARGLPPDWTTLDAGISWTDDRPDRRVDRLVTFLSEPHVGNKSSDLAYADLLSNVLPWLVDRRSKEAFWWKDHQNGRSGGPLKEDPPFDQLYLGAYIMSFGGSILYYPPMNVFEQPLTLGDVVGPYFNFSLTDPSVVPNLRENNPGKIATLGKPYPDGAHPGLSIVTVHAPVYYTGEWYGFTYDDIYMGHIGIDLSIFAVSKFLLELDSSLSRRSFGFVVDMSFNMYFITQIAVNMIYPERTGMEESRIHRDWASSTVVRDRRNQTYLVGDTIDQSPTNLTNANWTKLQEEVKKVSPGSRGVSEIDIVLTGDTKTTSFYAMYDRWSTIADLAIVILAPKQEVDGAIRVHFELSEIALETQVGTPTKGEVTLINDGILDVTVSSGSLPTWIELNKPLEGNTRLAAGERMTLEFTASTDRLPVGMTSSLFQLQVEDDEYPDCFFNQAFTATVSIRVLSEEKLNQLGQFRIYGFVLCGIIFATSLACALLVRLNAKRSIVRASQPIFLYMLCTGTFILGSSLLPLSIDDSLTSIRGCDMACMAFPWLAALGFSIAFSALFSKIWRVHRLFESSAEFRRRKVTAFDVIVPFCVIFTLNVALLTAWSISDPLEWERVQSSDSSSYGTCWSDPSNTQTSFLVLITVVNIAALILANVQAYRSRNISDEYSESRQIGFAMGGMLQVFLIGVPVMFLVVDSPTAFYFVQASLVFAVSMSLLLLIFVPKFLYLWAHRDALSSQQAENQILSRALKQSFGHHRRSQEKSTKMSKTSQHKEKSEREKETCEESHTSVISQEKSSEISKRYQHEDKSQQEKETSEESHTSAISQENSSEPSSIYQHKEKSEQELETSEEYHTSVISQENLSETSEQEKETFEEYISA